MAKTRINIAFDCGHMGSGKGMDPGATNGTRKECDDVLKMATRVMQIIEELSNNEIMCYRTRTGDKYQTLSDKSNWVKNWRKDGKKFDMCIAWHRDSAVATAKGGHICIQPGCSKDSKIMASNLSEVMKKHFPGRSSLVVSKNLHMNREVPCPSCLIEVGFISNNSDNAYFDNNFEKICQDLAYQIMRYYGVFAKKTETRYKVIISGMTDKIRQKRITDFLDANGYGYKAETYEVEL
ncbi:MAG: N-acetylmuramoyl-L-alanine amidase [Clostridium sp.]|uniref:N-acetylmuramoyl-L-alanine amidase n=1 Tax=Clostridium sp. TaxID=1506 RepID=UPI003F310FE1